MNVTAVRRGLAAALAQIQGLQVHDHIGSVLTPPSVEVGWPTIEFDNSFGRGTDRWELPVYLVVGVTVNEAASRLLEEFLDGTSTRSIKAALEADQTAGGACMDLHVARVTSGYDVDSGHLSATFTVAIIGAGT